ncbi:MAG: hypothetical protein WB507_04675 [Solirubrobacterales bacterium]
MAYFPVSLTEDASENAWERLMDAVKDKPGRRNQSFEIDGHRVDCFVIWEGPNRTDVRTAVAYAVGVKGGMVVIGEDSDIAGPVAKMPTPHLPLDF